MTTLRLSVVMYSGLRIGLVLVRSVLVVSQGVLDQTVLHPVGPISLDWHHSSSGSAGNKEQRVHLCVTFSLEVKCKNLSERVVEKILKYWF